PNADPHHRGLTPDPQEPGARLLDDLDVGLLLAYSELGQAGLDGLLNGWGAFFDFLHCRTSWSMSSEASSLSARAACPRACWLAACCRSRDRTSAWAGRQQAW